MDKHDESLMSSVLALNVTPKKHIFLFRTLLFNISKTRFNNKEDLLLLDLITLLITERLVLNRILKAYAYPVLNKKRLG